jgi:hypothetical protein
VAGIYQQKLRKIEENRLALAAILRWGERRTVSLSISNIETIAAGVGIQ